MSLVEYNGVPVSRGDLFINKAMTVLKRLFVKKMILLCSVIGLI
jgi:hypothetical protein